MKDLTKITTDHYVKDQDVAFNIDNCCQFIHDFNPKQDVQIYFIILKTRLLYPDPEKWLKIVKSMGFNFEYLEKDGNFTIGINNEDFTTSWQTYACYCMIRWLFETNYKGLIDRIIKTEENELKGHDWFEIIQIIHSLPNTGIQQWYAGHSLVNMQLNTFYIPVELDTFLNEKTFTSLNEYFNNSIRFIEKTELTINNYLNPIETIELAKTQFKNKYEKQIPQNLIKDNYICIANYGHCKVGHIVKEEKNKTLCKVLHPLVDFNRGYGKNINEFHNSLFLKIEDYLN